MPARIYTTSLLLAAWLCVASLAWADPTPRQQAESLFAEYRYLSERFDPHVADLYADDARIVNVRRYPGDVPSRALQLTGFQYKAKIRALMPIAKARGDDYSTFSDVHYSAEGERVRVDAVRFSVRKRYESPYSILVGPDQDGEWRIFEELSESRP